MMENGAILLLVFMPLKSVFYLNVPSDTKLLLTKIYSEMNIFEKLRISRVISGNSEITKNYSQGTIFVIISWQSA